MLKEMFSSAWQAFCCGLHQVPSSQIPYGKPTKSDLLKKVGRLLNINTRENLSVPAVAPCGARPFSRSCSLCLYFCFSCVAPAIFLSWVNTRAILAYFSHKKKMPCSLRLTRFYSLLLLHSLPHRRQLRTSFRICLHHRNRSWLLKRLFAVFLIDLYP